MISFFRSATLSLFLLLGFWFSGEVSALEVPSSGSIFNTSGEMLEQKIDLADYVDGENGLWQPKSR